jgi:rhamnosyltransferase
MKSDFDLSIIVPFKDEVLMLKRLLDGIKDQKTKLSYEIIVLDSSEVSFESNFTSLDMIIRWIKIDPKTFNHGLTRNFGVEKALGKVLIFTVQDAVPCDENWINHLANPIFDNLLDAVCGGQKPYPNKDTNPVEWHNPIEKPSIKIIDIGSHRFNELASIDKAKYVGWDNVNSAYSRKKILNVPFREMMFGEDAQWAVDAIINDLRIGYSGLSMVYHYHSFSLDFNIKRTLAEYYTKKKTINLNPIEPKLKLRNILSWMKSIIYATKNPFKIIYWIYYNFKIFDANKKAFKIWSEKGVVGIEKYLIKNVPMSIHGK